MVAPSTQKAVNEAAQRAYFVANGWPTNLDGTLTALPLLDVPQLRKLAQSYGRALQAEFATITPGRKRNTRARAA